MRHVDDTQAGLTGWPPSAASGSQRRNHRIQQRQRHRRPRATQKSRGADRCFLGDQCSWIFLPHCSRDLLPGGRRFRYRDSSHLKWNALHDSDDQRRKTIVVAAGVCSRDRAHGRHVVVFQRRGPWHRSAAFRSALREHADRPTERPASPPGRRPSCRPPAARGIDRRAAVARAPGPDQHRSFPARIPSGP